MRSHPIPFSPYTLAAFREPPPDALLNFTLNLRFGPLAGVFLLQGCTLVPTILCGTMGAKAASIRAASFFQSVFLFIIVPQRELGAHDMHSIGQGCPTGIVYGLAFRGFDLGIERDEAGSFARLARYLWTTARPCPRASIQVRQPTRSEMAADASQRQRQGLSSPRC